ncbi:hypothetical protein SAMN05216389_104241 [Oceanobacillus limi]|uniref:Uncharacterized protein n=1 Tax=Oceanobacillus limi TaxID=930131 RepID=A0A1I0BAZ5_9BACI|nr:hypothetical protein [Oceanobacillus limi]SET03259.1 hypothetical protein SAMN05216389_104241 [Oceanobacillus limi]
MPYKGKDQYRTQTGDYKNKTGELEFGYEYTSGNRLKRKNKKDNGKQ